MKRTLLLFVVLVLGVGGLRAQHFEWAKGYSSGQEGNRIVGSVTDSLGNLYILGQFRNTAAWDGGSHLLPMAPYGYGSNVLNVLIAKITPDGTMAWKKVIHANNGWGGNAYDIKPVGDTAFACLLAFPLPKSGDNYCYYLDTLLTTTCDYPTPNGNMDHATRMALITFDFDGHVLEQHFLTLTFLDNNGNDIVRQIFNTDYYINMGDFCQPSFDIDHNGNVYICRVGGDLVDQTYATWRGNVGGIKYWVDGRVVGRSEVRNSPLMWYPQLLKFSPHMDSLLASRYLIQQSDTNIDYQTDNLYMKLNRDGNPYVVGTLNQLDDNNNILVLDTINGVQFGITRANHVKGYMLRLNDNLNVIQCIHLTDSVIHPDQSSSMTMFHDITFDYENDLTFISASTKRTYFSDTTTFYSILMCQNIPLTTLHNDAFIMVFENQGDSMHFKSYGRVPAKISSNLETNSHINLVCSKNRILIQSQYIGGITLPNHNIQFPQWSDRSLGLIVFDYNGNIINGEHYSAISSQNEPGPITLHDSILFLSTYITSDATFGDIHVPAQGYNACIAKYVDTAFMTPYVYTGDTGNVRIVVAEGGTWTSYPNPFRQRVNIEVEDGGLKVERAWLTDIQGRCEAVRLQPNGPNRYVLDLTGRPQASYLLTLVTVDGQQRTLRLLKQEDMFGE